MIEVTIGPKASEPEKSKYPYVGENDGWLVLFTGANTGVALNVPKFKTTTRVGSFSSTWSERNFTPVSGPITLQNT